MLSGVYLWQSRSGISTRPICRNVCVGDSNISQRSCRSIKPKQLAFESTVPNREHWRVHSFLQHPNLCVANLLGEVCPIVQKFPDFFGFLGGRLKPLRLHESRRELRMEELEQLTISGISCMLNAACFDSLGG